MMRTNTAALALFLLLPGCLAAQDFFGAGMSAQSAARAGIFTPGVDNVLDALAMNPAGLSELMSPSVNLTAMGVLARGSFRNGANPDSPMRFNGGGLPFGAAGMPLGTRWAVAVGFLPDLLSTARWQFADPLYGPQHERSAILAFRVTTGLSYRVTSRISVGATFSGIYNSNTLVMPYVFQSNPALKGLKTLLDLHTTGLGRNASFGATAQVSARWTLGAMYRTTSSITSNGSASGNMGAQFAALGIPFRPDFAYRAQVAVELPQAANVTATWQATNKLRASFASGWTGWHGAFANLPVSLTGGTNADINGFLGANSIKDTVPLDWKNQFSLRGAVERSFSETWSMSGGYVHQNSPVPSSTLSPMTAAIMGDSLTTGVGYRRGRARFDVAYQISLTVTQNVGTSALLAGDFSRSQVRVGTQALTLSASLHR
jgi:long-subunit fatty acid transport protein